MDLLKKNDLHNLIRSRDEMCVSLYMPTYRKGKRVKQNAIRFKNLLYRVKHRLAEHGLKAAVVVDILSPGEKLLDDSLFWQHQSDGLAVFFSAGLFRFYRLPFRFKETAVVATKRFYIKPILPLFIGNGKFYIIAVSQKSVRLLQGTHYALQEVDLSQSSAPRSIAETLQYDDPESQLQFHTGTTSRVGERAAIYHGHGVGIDDKKDNLLRYFREIDQGLNELLHDESAPLVFAGVDYLFPIYRKANTYSCLVDRAIEGNPDGLDDEILHKEAWQIVSPQFLSTQKEHQKTFEDLTETKRASNEISAVLPAATEGRVEVLFLALDKQKWGIYDPAGRDVHLHSQRAIWDEDLLDACAAQTLLHGGTVYSIKSSKIPGGKDVAALFRY